MLHARTRSTSIAGAAVAAFALLGAGAIGTEATAKQLHQITVERCGYTRAEYGRSGVYPWHMTCAAARSVIAGSDDPHAQSIGFGPGWDGGAVRIYGSYWVCTGQMGEYNCGYPYRPYTFKGEKGYRGPFTKDVEFLTCSELPSGCPAADEFVQPSR
jgi:hypothetical protein